jgi:hypothetical protein
MPFYHHKMDIFFNDLHRKNTCLLGKTPYPIISLWLILCCSLIHRDIPALPFSKLKKKLPKPLGDSYISNPCTIGEKLRNKRIEKELL